MRVLVLHDAEPGEIPHRPPFPLAAPGKPPPDQVDNLEQARAVGESLAALGHRAERLGFDGDPRRLKSALAGGWDLVFNLVETPRGGGRRVGLAPLVMESLGIPFTGCSSRALYVTSHKPAAKAMMRRAGVPTPPWIASPRGAGGARNPSGARAGPAGQGSLPWHCQEWPGPGRYILKSVWEHASIGLDGSGVVWADRPEELSRLLACRSSREEGLFFAERYVEGREFNLSLLSGPAGAEVLPPAEMLFLEPSAAGPRCAHPRILCYRSKWEPDSPEYALTRRSFALEPGDGPLLERLRELALRCWGLFGLTGYARVDFRVGPRGPQILEINANPCIAPDSGFAAAAARGGLGYRNLVERILAHPAPVRVPAGRQRRG